MVTEERTAKKARLVAPTVKWLPAGCSPDWAPRAQAVVRVPEELEEAVLEASKMVNGDVSTRVCPGWTVLKLSSVTGVAE